MSTGPFCCNTPGTTPRTAVCVLRAGMVSLNWRSFASSSGDGTGGSPAHSMTYSWKDLRYDPPSAKQRKQNLAVESNGPILVLDERTCGLGTRAV